QAQVAAGRPVRQSLLQSGLHQLILRRSLAGDIHGRGSLRRLPVKLGNPPSLRNPKNRNTPQSLDSHPATRFNTPSSSAQVAQSVEQGTENPRVGGSIPPLGTTNNQGLAINDRQAFFVSGVPV